MLTLVYVLLTNFLLGGFLFAALRDICSGKNDRAGLIAGVTIATVCGLTLALGVAAAWQVSEGLF